MEECHQDFRTIAYLGLFVGQLQIGYSIFQPTPFSLASWSHKSAKTAPGWACPGALLRRHGNICRRQRPPQWSRALLQMWTCTRGLTCATARPIPRNCLLRHASAWHHPRAHSMKIGCTLAQKDLRQLLLGVSHCPNLHLQLPKVHILPSQMA